MTRTLYVVETKARRSADWRPYEAHEHRAAARKQRREIATTDIARVARYVMEAK